MFRPFPVQLIAAFVLVIIAACGGGGGGSSPPPADRIGRVPLAGDVFINEFLAAPVMDANCDAISNATQDEFVELVSSTTDTLDLSNVTISDAAMVRHSFPAGAYLRPSSVLVVYGGGSPNCAVPAGVTISVASTGSLGLNNAGDDVTVKSEGGVVLDSTTFVNATSDVSFNRSPDGVAGSPFALHTSLIGAVGNYSPATRATGSVF